MFVVTGMSIMTNMKSAHRYYNGIWTNSNAHMHIKRLRVANEEKYMCTFNTFKLDGDNNHKIITIQNHIYTVDSFKPYLLRYIDGLKIRESNVKINKTHIK